MPSRPKSTSELVALLQAEPSPLLLLDTCAILDVPRNFYRSGAPQTLVALTRTALQAAGTKPSTLRLLIAERVIHEFSVNRTDVLAELGTHIAQVTRIGNTLLDVADSGEFGASLGTLEANLTALTDQLLDSCLVISNDPLCHSRAGWRLSTGTSPAKRGSANDGDCVIIEHYLELVRQLRAAGFMQDCIFISSNFRDFGVVPALKSPLDAEFAAIKLDYLSDIAAVLGQLGY